MSQAKTDFFNVDSEVRQEDSLSALLFNNMFDFIMSIDEIAKNGTK